MKRGPGRRSPAPRAARLRSRTAPAAAVPRSKPSPPAPRTAMDRASAFRLARGEPQPAAGRAAGALGRRPVQAERERQPVPEEDELAVAVDLLGRRAERLAQLRLQCALTVEVGLARGRGACSPGSARTASFRAATPAARRSATARAGFSAAWLHNSTWIGRGISANASARPVCGFSAGARSQTAIPTSCCSAARQTSSHGSGTANASLPPRAPPGPTPRRGRAGRSPARHRRRRRSRRGRSLVKSPRDRRAGARPGILARTMNEGELILAAGALLAAGLLAVADRGAPARARPRAVPGRRDARRLGRLRAGSRSTTTSSRADVGIVALALILFEGGLTAGLPRSARCSARVQPRDVGTLVTAR